jgi:general secretion pathway protein K
MGLGRVHHSLRSILAPQRGIALLMVLWVLTILMVVVFSFSYLVRTETFSSRAFKEGWENKFLAEAGIERALMELFYRKQNPQNLEAEDQEVWRIDGTEQVDTLGGGYYRVRLVDESGKIDLNLAPEVILRNLLYSLDLPGDDKDLLVNTIVDSILDWKDPDDFIRLHGAESEYYQSLPHPYKAKNGNFDTVEELILVKGITPEILYGSGQKPGLVDFLTVQAKTNKINLNAAPKEVLTALPGMTPEMAEAVVAYRQDQEIKSLQEIAGLLGEVQAQLASYVTVSAGNTFTIESRGYKKNNQTGYGIQAKVMLEGTNRYHYLSYKNPVIIKTEKGALE